MVNWERKSSYLLREIVKFSTYIDCLHTAQRAKESIYAERAEREKMKEERENEAGTHGEGADGELETLGLEMTTNTVAAKDAATVQG